MIVAATQEVLGLARILCVLEGGGAPLLDGMISVRCTHGWDKSFRKDSIHGLFAIYLCHAAFFISKLGAFKCVRWGFPGWYNVFYQEAPGLFSAPTVGAVDRVNCQAGAPQDPSALHQIIPWLTSLGLGYKLEGFFFFENTIFTFLSKGSSCFS